MAEVLIVEDDRSTLEALKLLVQDEGFEVATASCLAQARTALDEESPGLILADLNLPDGKGSDLLGDGEAGGPELILITGDASVETAVEALRLGALDYLTKPVDVARLKTLLATFNRTTELKKQVTSLRGELREAGRFGAMVGASKQMQEVYELVERVAPTDATVLVTGESGTGKELVAETVHRLSRRSAKPLLPLNCGAVSANLIESELFGHERGSFTGADRRHLGHFERADGGTLFLDEITEMPIELQVKLLRALENREVTRVGGSKPVPVDVRVVAASNRDLRIALDGGKLREDLYYRLKVFPIALPPLREREGDVELLARHFLAELNHDHEVQKRLTDEALDLLQAHPWPGNVRELKNVLQRAYILADEKITVDTLPREVRLELAAEPTAGPYVQVRIGSSLADAEKRLIFATLDQVGGKKKDAAEILGVSLKTLYNRLKAYEQRE
ncbi:MAG TPA: sigma-54 dependent transcriptional regulator [Thermoanaerobaculia bacterium]|nr:sigma-54 dependent transcriptional regulator [Thermoanaerobaculia bacterium]